MGSVSNDFVPLSSGIVLAVATYESAVSTYRLHIGDHMLLLFPVLELAAAPVAAVAVDCTTPGFSVHTIQLRRFGAEVAAGISAAGPAGAAVGYGSPLEDPELEPVKLDIAVHTGSGLVESLAVLAPVGLAVDSDAPN